MSQRCCKIDKSILFKFTRHVNRKKRIQQISETPKIEEVRPWKMVYSTALKIESLKCTVSGLFFLYLG